MLASAAAKWPSRHFHAHIKQEVPLTPPLPPPPPPPLHSSFFFSSPHFFLSLPPLFLPPSLPLATSFRLLPKEKSTYHDLCPRTCQRRSSRNILVKTLTLLGKRLRIRWRTVVLVLKTSPGCETSFTDDFWKSLPVKLTAEETSGGVFFSSTPPTATSLRSDSSKFHLLIAFSWSKDQVPPGELGVTGSADKFRAGWSSAVNQNHNQNQSSYCCCCCRCFRRLCTLIFTFTLTFVFSFIYAPFHPLIEEEKKRSPPVAN